MSFRYRLEGANHGLVYPRWAVCARLSLRVERHLTVTNQTTFLHSFGCTGLD